MKLNTLVISLILVVSTPSMASTCIGGLTFQGKNGHEYCLGPAGLNWWSAHQWCNAQGRRLATPNEACDHNTYIWGGNAPQCPNLSGIDASPNMNYEQVWLNLIADDNNVYTTGVYGHSNPRHVFKPNDARFETDLEPLLPLCY